MVANKKVVLCILDGWGHREDGAHNAIALAKTPHYDRLWHQNPHSLLDASEQFVGLPCGQMGNSEVGHMTIGAGRIILNDLPRINEAIREHHIAANPTFQGFIGHAKKGTCHVMALLSDGGIHSHQDHLEHLIVLLASHDIHVALHLFLDGRDTPPQSAALYLERLLQVIAPCPTITIATMGGRYFAMDRDKRWDRIQRAYETMVHPALTALSPIDALHTAYAAGETDEFIQPVAFEGYHGIKPGDTLFMTNFRADRARQLLASLLDPAFDGFPTKPLHLSAVLGMMSYSEHLDVFMEVLFPPEHIKDTLGDVVAAHSLRQLRIAETEKYAHVTFFFNGGREELLYGEERLLIPSPAVKTYDQQPEMSAVTLTDQLVAALDTQTFSLVVANYANADMVGHTGKMEATILAIQAVDECLGRLSKACHNNDYVLIITADHGNAETMQEDGKTSPHTAHTCNRVPLIIEGLPYAASLKSGNLSDIAPTILTILDREQPALMTGKSCIVREAP